LTSFTAFGRGVIFTGIVRLATVAGNESQRGGRQLAIESAGLHGLAEGSSVAVNGACLTVTSLGAATLRFDVVPETLARTNLGELQPGDAVNVEASLRMGDEMGGHFLFGHVDATTVVLSKTPEGNGARMWCVTPPACRRFVAEKGYIALDGVSLTVAAVSQGQFAVALVPETLTRSTLGRKEAGSALNFEADPIARYVAHVLEMGRRS
jgi:riboflavin synthase